MLKFRATHALLRWLPTAALWYSWILFAKLASSSDTSNVSPLGTSDSEYRVTCFLDLKVGTSVWTHCHFGKAYVRKTGANSFKSTEIYQGRVTDIDMIAETIKVRFDDDSEEQDNLPYDWVQYERVQKKRDPTEIYKKPTTVFKKPTDGPGLNVFEVYHSVFPPIRHRVGKYYGDITDSRPHGPGILIYGADINDANEIKSLTRCKLGEWDKGSYIRDVNELITWHGQPKYDAIELGEMFEAQIHRRFHSQQMKPGGMTDGIVTMKGVYKGFVKDNRPHGIGTLSYTTLPLMVGRLDGRKVTVQGYWSNGKFVKENFYDEPQLREFDQELQVDEPQDNEPAWAH